MGGVLSEGKWEEKDRGVFFPRIKVRAVTRHCSSYTPTRRVSGGSKRVYRASEIKPLRGSCATLSTLDHLRGIWRLILLQGG